jgi:hypothetical protein
VDLEALLAAVERRFEVTGRALPQWDDPHRGEPPADDEYSRVTDPGRWRIIGARADAWLAALVDLDIASIDDRAPARSWTPMPVAVTSFVRLTPRAPAALPLVVGRSRIDDVDDAGVVLGVGDPATTVAWFPDCGCDACDHGSQLELEDLDAHLHAIVSGQFRRLSSKNRTITVLRPGWWSASGLHGRARVEAILERPRGWDELAGSPWLPARLPGGPR